MPGSAPKRRCQNAWLMMGTFRPCGSSVWSRLINPDEPIRFGVRESVDKSRERRPPDEDVRETRGGVSERSRYGSTQIAGDGAPGAAALQAHGAHASGRHARTLARRGNRAFVTRRLTASRTHQGAPGA